MSSSNVTSNEPVRKLGSTFHRSFSLVRNAVADVLKLANNPENHSDTAGCLDRETIGQLTLLGNIYVEAMPRYGYGMGMLTDGNCLTAFGKAAIENDPLLERPETLWLMHYFLTAPLGPGPAFWHEIVTTCFRTGDEFTGDDISRRVSTVYERLEGKELAERSMRSTATVFAGTYTKEEALGKLGMLEEVSTGSYRVLEPDPPSPWVFGYALLNYWQAHFGERLTINLDTLYDERGLSGIFMCGAGRINRMLTTLQIEGYVDVYRTAPPYQLVLIRPDSNSLLQKIYG